MIFTVLRATESVILPTNCRKIVVFAYLLHQFTTVALQLATELLSLAKYASEEKVGLVREAR